MLSDAELLGYNQRGLIPGPHEDEEAFLKRISALRNPLPLEEWGEAGEITARLFDFRADWIPIAYSNAQLMPWHAAMTWISEEGPSIQLRKAFKKGSYLRTYFRDEVLAHEAVHGARMAFDEPRFEELFAYCTSKKNWKRLLGPLFRFSWESTLFAFLLLCPLLSQSASLFFQDHWGFQLLYWLPGIGLALALFRLLWARRRFQQCLSRITSCLKDETKAAAFLFRLTDREIELFSRLSQPELKAYFAQQTSLRWRLLSLAYLPSAAEVGGRNVEG